MNETHEEFDYKLPLYIKIAIPIIIIISISLMAFTGDDDSYKHVKETIKEIRFSGTFEKGYIEIDTDIQTYIVKREDVTFEKGSGLQDVFKADYNYKGELMHPYIELTEESEKKLNKIYAKMFNETLTLSEE